MVGQAQVSQRLSASTEKIYRLIGHASFAVLLVYGLIFFMERTLYIDSAYQLFAMVNKEGFEIFDGRYSMFLSQLLPLAAIKLGLPLWVVLVSYSLSFFLMFYLAWWICVYRLKNVGAGIVINLIVFLVADAFVHGISETWQVIVFSSLLYAWTEFGESNEKKVNVPVFYGVATLLIAILFGLHPGSILLILFVFGLQYFDKKAFKSLRYYLLAGISFLPFFIKMMMTKSGSREGKFYDNFKELGTDIFRLGELNSVKFFCRGEYFVIIALLIVVLIILILRREYLKAGFILVANFLFWFITSIAFKQGDSYLAMYSRYMPLILTVGLPFVLEVVCRESFQLPKIILVLVLIISGYVRIAKITKRTYTKRQRYIGALLHEGTVSGANKVYVHADSLDRSTLLVPWGIALETTMMTSLWSPNNTQTLYVENHDELEGINVSERQFLSVPWWLNAWGEGKINTKYFRLKKESYSKLNHPSPKGYRGVRDYERLIRGDANWMNNIKEKASKEGIPVEEMVRRDAEYMLKKEREGFL